MVGHYVGVFVLAPWSPWASVKVDAFDGGHLVVEDMGCIGQAFLGEIRGEHVGGKRMLEELVIATNDDDVFESMALRAQPIVEVGKFVCGAIVCEIASVDEDVGSGQMLFLQRAMQHVCVADVQQ